MLIKKEAIHSPHSRKQARKQSWKNEDFWGTKIRAPQNKFRRTRAS